MPYDLTFVEGSLDPMAFSESFFEVSAQLIPVLFLALVLEEWLRPGARETPGDRVARSWASTPAADG